MKINSFKHTEGPQNPYFTAMLIVNNNFSLQNVILSATFATTSRATKNILLPHL